VVEFPAEDPVPFQIGQVSQVEVAFGDMDELKQKNCQWSGRKLLESGHQGKLLALSHDHLLLKQIRFFICSCSQGKV